MYSKLKNTMFDGYLLLFCDLKSNIQSISTKKTDRREKNPNAVYVRQQQEQSMDLCLGMGEESTGSSWGRTTWAKLSWVSATDNLIRKKSKRPSSDS